MRTINYFLSIQHVNINIHHVKCHSLECNEGQVFQLESHLSHTEEMLAVKGAKFKRHMWNKFYSTPRVVDVWNVLPGVVVKAEAIVTFRRLFRR